MIPAQFEYESPRELNEVLALLASREDAKLLAGGHSLLPAMKLRLASPAVLVDLSRVAGLNYIREAGDTMHIGAMTTHADPAADYPAAVLALDADVVAMSKRGERIIPARDFFTGLFTTALAPDEVITEVRVPVTGPAATTYKKFAHPASGMAVVGVAVVVKMRAATIGSAAIGITGVAQFAYRATAVEKALVGKSASGIPSACDFAADGVEVLGDYFASVEYRSHLARVYTRRALQECAASVKK